MTVFKKIAISGITALSLTLTPMPSVAAPDGEDVIKTIAGLAVLGIIANEINDRDRNRSRTTTTRTKTRAYDPYQSIEGHRSPRVIEGQILRPRDRDNRVPKKVRRARLPDQCLRILDTNRGDRLVYAQRCLKRNYVYADRLPNRCKLHVQTNNRVRTVYGARCLAKDGWRVAGR